MLNKKALAKRVAVITGSTRGIGRAIAFAYGQAGAKVVLSSSRAEAVEQTCQAFREQGIVCLGIPCDVSEKAQVANLLAQTVAEWGQVDVWVNNAGISGPYAATLDVPSQTWERVLQTNLFGCYYGCLTVLPQMLKQKSGKIINLSGGGARKAQRFLSAYSTSKAAITRLTDGLAQEYRAHKWLSINLLEPGIVATDMLTHGEALGEAVEAFKALPRILRIFGTTPEETAALALHMASSKTDGISGRVFKVMPRQRALWRLGQTLLRLR